LAKTVLLTLPREVELPEMEKVIAIPFLGGLHYLYRRTG